MKKNLCKRGHQRIPGNLSVTGACLACRRLLEGEYRNKVSSVSYSKEYAKKYRENNPDKIKNATLKYKFGITLGEFNTLLARQNYKCAICLNDLNNTCKADTAHVDHDHTTNEVRGLLCDWCNKGLGNFTDDVAVLLRAIAYLNKDKKQYHFSVSKGI